MTQEAQPAGRFQATDASEQGWRAAFPPARWLRTYEPRWLAKDAIAGLTLAAYGIPVSLA
ncbi:MAG TPA: DNA repair protein, partial [Variovorax sp.]|nr:DNA repair protein [Variovorax sp.]